MSTRISFVSTSLSLLRPRTSLFLIVAVRLKLRAPARAAGVRVRLTPAVGRGERLCG